METGHRNHRIIDAALLVARIALALPFLYHGAAIAFGAFGGPGPAGFAAYTHLPLAVALLVGYGQFLGGLGILFGVLSRAASVGLIVIMLGAIFLVHWPHGYDITKGGIEHALTMLLLALVMLIAGPGAYTALALVRGPRAEEASRGTPTPIWQ